MKTKMLRALLVLLLLVPFASFPVPAQAAVIGGQLYGTGGDITVEILPADAGFTSALYLYSPVFRLIGTNREVGKVVTLTGIAAGEELVFGIQVHDTGDIFKMGPGSRNIDGRAHAAVTQIAERAFDVGFEDMAFTGDWDYNDNMFRFTGALAPVPPPVDNVPPVTVHGPLPAANGYGWLNQPVTISFTATDTAQPGAAVSGVERIYPTLDGAAQGCPPGDSCTLSVAASGMHDVSYYARDNAGNTGAEQQLSLQIDLDAPIIMGAPNRVANANGWINDGAIVNFVCSDLLSGIADCTAPLTLGEGADQNVTGTAADMAGNTASATVNGINIDMTAPVVAYSGNAGSYAVDQMIAITCAASDALSGLESSDCADISGPAYDFALGSHSYTASATDLAGNTTQATV
ncbi:MAG TPA: hypothetical protein VNT01_01945, partial [Symbiobacteriaceae bacterium]|nr:hypothetical protein [Symbiobacteriaceae bacterium]